MLINLDFSQIEVCVLAWLSQDEAFLELIRNGTDIYKYFACLMYDKKESDITKEERDSLKVPILGMSYGRGVKALSEETGKSEEWCKNFINTFYEQFPKVKQLHDKWIEEVNKTGQLHMFSGIDLTFKYYEKTWSEDYQCWFRAGYKPTEIKNYPVQHSAFTFLSVFLSTFYREKAIHNRDKYLLINTVHDSVMLDCINEYVDDAIKDLQDILDKMQDLVYNLYRINLNVPIRAEIKTGQTWYEI